MEIGSRTIKVAYRNCEKPRGINPRIATQLLALTSFGLYPYVRYHLWRPNHFLQAFNPGTELYQSVVLLLFGRRLY